MAGATSIPSDPLLRVSTRARRGRVLGGSLALVVSLCAHGVLATVAGVTIWAVGARPRPPSTGVEIEIAEAPAPVMLDMPAREVLPPAALARRPPARRLAFRAIAAAMRAAAAAPAPDPTPAPVPSEPHAPADDEPTPPVMFAMSAGTVAAHAVTRPSMPAPAAPSGAGSPGGHGASPDGATAEPVLDAAAVDVPATLVSHRPALYPQAARMSEVEGDVPVEIVVSSEGSVVSARVLADADGNINMGYGLEAAALQAVRAYRFTPARRAGHPVRVRMRWTVQFRLR